MNLILDGHHYKYELESLANMFFHENKVRVVEEKDFSQGEYLYTSLSRNMFGIITLKVFLFQPGRETSGRGISGQTG